MLDTGRYVFGEELEHFEEAFASYCGVRFAVGVASGTDAITIASRPSGVRPGDEVMTVANTCVPTIVGIEERARGPYSSIANETYTIDPRLLEEAITPRTRAIVPVHLYGQCADLKPILRDREHTGDPVIEDCAQAHGAEYKGRRAGSFGRPLRSASTHQEPRCSGRRGAVVTNDDDVGDRARLLRNYGERARFEHVLRGRNSRLDSLQAAFLAASFRSWTSGTSEADSRG